MSLNKIIEMMDRLDLSHREMLELGELKKQVLIRNDVNELMAVMKLEAKLAKRIEVQENERIEAVNAFLRERGIKSQLRLNVTELARLVFDPEDKSRLLEARARLAETLKSLKRLNSTNKQLIEQALSYTEYAIDLFSYKDDDDPVYQSPAKQSTKTSRPGLFDARA